MTGRGTWVVRTYTAGGVGEKIKFWLPDQQGKPGSRKGKSSLKKQEQNDYNCERRLARLINANFCKRDYLIGLDYSEISMARLHDRCVGMDPAYDTLPEEQQLDIQRKAAEAELRNCLKRVRRALGKEVEFKYIAVTSDMDGETGEIVRVHHHLVIESIALDAFVEKWGLGSVDFTRLWDVPDYSGLAHYLCAQVRRVPDEKKYISSRNLIRPVPKDRIVATGAELRVPRGAKLLHRAEYTPGKPQYIRYILPEKTGDGLDKAG